MILRRKLVISLLAISVLAFSGCDRGSRRAEQAINNESFKAKSEASIKMETSPGAKAITREETAGEVKINEDTPTIKDSDLVKISEEEETVKLEGIEELNLEDEGIEALLRDEDVLRDIPNKVDLN